MIVKAFLIAAIAALQPSPAPLSDPSTVMIDGHIRKPRNTAVAYAFDCGGTAIRLAFHQEWLPLEEVPLAKAQSVRLGGLSIGGRRMAPSDDREVRDLFASFAWIERAQVNCPGEQIQISIHGMPHRPWVEHLEQDLDTRPRPTIRVINVAADGAVRID